MRDYPFREIGNRELGSSEDERSGCSMVETPRAVIDHPISGGYVSRDFPFREIGNRELGSPDDERSGCSMVETPKQS
jgi:hypothetical protein